MGEDAGRLSAEAAPIHLLMLKLRHPLHPKVMRLLKVKRLLMPVSKEKRPPRPQPGVTPPTKWAPGSTMLVFVPFAEKGVSQILDPMEVFPLKRPLRKVTRLLKVTSLKKWKKPLKKLLQKNAAGGANFALADSETERIKFVLNLFCFVLQGETFCLNLKLANKNKTFPIHRQSNKISHHVIQCILIQFLQCVQNLCKLRE